MWRDIKVYANHAFIVSEAIDHGMQVFDLTRLRGVSAPETFAETAHYTGFGRRTRSRSTGRRDSPTPSAPARATAACTWSTSATPTAPRTAGCVSHDGYTHETQCVVYHGPDATYAAARSASPPTRHADHRRRHQQGAPVQLSRTGYVGSALHAPGMADRGSALLPGQRRGRRDGFRHPTRTYIWDVTDLDAPVIASRLQRPDRGHRPQPVHPRPLVYQANYRGGLRILDAAGSPPRAARGRLLRHLSRRTKPELQRRMDKVPVLRQRHGHRQRHRAGTVRGPGHTWRYKACLPDSRSQSAGPGERCGRREELRGSWSRVIEPRPGAPAPAYTSSRCRRRRRSSCRRVLAGHVLAGAPSPACDLGSLAPGSDAFIVVTIRATAEGDAISTAVANGGPRRDRSGRRSRPRPATTRVVLSRAGADAPAARQRHGCSGLDATTPCSGRCEA